MQTGRQHCHAQAVSARWGQRHVADHVESQQQPACLSSALSACTSDISVHIFCQNLRVTACSHLSLSSDNLNHTCSACFTQHKRFYLAFKWLLSRVICFIK